MARLAELGQRVGYGLFGVAIAVFVAGAVSGFRSAEIIAVVTCLAIGSAVLAPAIVIGYGVRAAEREDREVADVTLQALAALEPAANQVAVDAVVVTPMGNQSVVTATLVLVSGHQEEVFAGSAVVRPAGEYDAVARAVLDGTNRRVVSRG